MTPEESDLVNRCLGYVELSKHAARNAAVTPPKEADFIQCIRQLGAIRTSAAIEALEQVVSAEGIHASTYTVAFKALELARSEMEAQHSTAPSDSPRGPAGQLLAPGNTSNTSWHVVFAATAQISYLVLTGWLALFILHFIWPGVVSRGTADTVFGVGILLYLVSTVGLKGLRKRS